MSDPLLTNRMLCKRDQILPRDRQRQPAGSTCLVDVTQTVSSRFSCLLHLPQTLRLEEEAKGERA